MFLPVPYMDDNPLEGDKEPVLALMLANAFAAVFWRPEWYALLGFDPAAPRWWSLLTAQFLHVDGWQLCLNMWFLWLFGDNVHRYLGWRFWPLYLGCGAAGFLSHWLLPVAAGPAVGSSGGVAGVTAAYLVFFPRARLRVLAFARHHTSHFTMSALFFGLFALAYQLVAMFGGAGKHAVWVFHAGGLVAGLVAAAFLRRGPQAGLSAVALSGGAGSRPLAGAAALGEAAVVESAIREGRESDALEAFSAALRRDPAFELAPNAQLWAADRLARAGHAHLARAALERFAARHAGDAHFPHAMALLGYVRESCLGDLEGAVAAYRAAAEHAAAPAALRADAGARWDRAAKRLRATFAAAPKEDERYAVVMEGSEPPEEAGLRLVAEATGGGPEQVRERLAKAPGFLVRWMECREAGALGESLEAAGLPVVVVAESALVKLAPAGASGPPQAGANGLRLGGSSGEVLVAWSDCLLLAAGGVGCPKSSEKQRGLFELADFDVLVSRRGYYRHRRRYGSMFGRSTGGIFGSSHPDSIYINSGPVKEYETSTVHVPMLELMRVDGARWRWTPCPDLEVDDGKVQSFFDVLQALVTAAPAIPVERGALAAFDRRIPEDSLFGSVEAWDAHLLWQAQLAALKRPK